LVIFLLKRANLWQKYNMAISEIHRLFDSLRSVTKRRLVIANGVDVHSIEAAAFAQKSGWVTVSITGERDFFERQCNLANISPNDFLFLNCVSEEEAVLKAVELVRNNEADLIMKGLVNSDKFLKALLDKKKGILISGKLLSHIALIFNSVYGKPLLVSDVAIIPLPTFEQKVKMTENLIDVAHKLGIKQPKVAFIAATEQIIPNMIATLDAGKLKELWQNGGLKGSICEGPMAIDLVLDKESASIKNFNSPVAGDADCLLFPNIESGNVFYKTNTKLCGAHTAAIVIGTMVPVILSSRGDSMETKLNSIAFAALIG
jgi:phosphotransacetylase